MRLLRVAAVLASFGALSAAAGAASPNGLYGVVTKGPTQPVCRVGKPCTAPVQVTLVFSRPGHPALRTRSAANGVYRIALPPGYYTVRSVERIGFSQTPRPAKVHVRTGHWDKISFVFDTGIR
jgi:hypothetical protein